MRPLVLSLLAGTLLTGAAAVSAQEPPPTQEHAIQEPVAQDEALMQQPAIGENYPIAQLRMLDKTTARNVTFEAKVGSTLKFGSLYIRTQACRKASPIEQPESASFLQIWEVPLDNNPNQKSEWVFSGWMYASSPALSAMDHAVYDVWVIDCLKPNDGKTLEEEKGVILEGEGEVKDNDEPALPAISAEELPVDYD